jgi:hypothetical protein
MNPTVGWVGRFPTSMLFTTASGCGSGEGFCSQISFSHNGATSPWQVIVSGKRGLLEETILFVPAVTKQ